MAQKGGETRKGYKALKDQRIGKKWSNDTCLILSAFEKKAFFILTLPIYSIRIPYAVSLQTCFSAYRPETPPLPIKREGLWKALRLDAVGRMRKLRKGIGPGGPAGLQNLFGLLSQEIGGFDSLPFPPLTFFLEKKKVSKEKPVKKIRSRTVLAHGGL